MAKVIGLNTSVTQDALSHSAVLLNGLPPDTSFPATGDLKRPIDDLCKLIEAYDLQSIFQLQLMHRHTEIPNDHVLLGKRLEEWHGYWTAPTHTACVDLNHVRGSSYCLDSSGNFSPTEFRVGLPDKSLQVNPQFLDAFCKYVRTNDLGAMFGLQVMSESNENMVEFSYDIGNILLPESAVKIKIGPNVQLQTTAWTITRNGDLVDHDGGTDCIKVFGEHCRVSKIKNVSEVLDILRHKGFLDV